MEFRDVLHRRRMMRRYRPDPVPRSTIERIVLAGVSAPSAGHAQGQSFLVITDRAMRGEVARLASEAQYVERGFDPWLSVAPVHIVICTTAHRYLTRYAEEDKSRSSLSVGDWPVPYWWVDAGASMMAILLAAVDEDLAAGFLGAHAIPGLRDLLGIPPGTDPIGVITVGQPAPDRRSSSLARGRLPLSDVVRWEHWNR